jgi:hypothetical protein
MKKNLCVLSYLIVMALGLSIGVTSCKDKEDPAPEIVQDETAYYVIGEVVSNGQSLEGVKVSVSGTEATTGADGKFELKLTAVGKYTVAFAKDGYVSVSSAATIASSAKNKTSVAIRQELTRKSAPVQVNPDADAQITGNESNILLDIAAGSVNATTNISMTPFIPGTRDDLDDLGVNLVALNLEPDGQTFAKPVELKVKNPMGTGVHFSNVTHVVEKNGTTQKLGDVEYDEESESYKVMLNGFSNHYFMIGANVSQGTAGTEVLSTGGIDNIGSPAAVSQNITVQQRYGWVIDGDLTRALTSKYPTLRDATISTLASSFESAAASIMGSNAGFGDLSLTMPFNVSGDTQLSIEVVSQTLSYTLAFPLIFENGTVDNFEVTVKKYVGTEIRTTYRYGSSHPDHSGGSGS